MNTSGNPGDALRQECWNRAIHAYGTASIFKERAARCQGKLRKLTFLGIAVPVVVGGIVLSFGTNGSYLPFLITVAGLLGIVQLVMSLWSLVAKWDSIFAYSLESATDNRRLATQFEKLANNPPTDLATRFEMLDATYQARSDADVGQVVTDKEQRFALRVGLHRFRRPCVECGIVPDLKAPSTCSVCGE